MKTAFGLTSASFEDKFCGDVYDLKFTVAFLICEGSSESSAPHFFLTHLVIKKY